jgi:hypothetical protein
MKLIEWPCSKRYPSAGRHRGEERKIHRLQSSLTGTWCSAVAAVFAELRAQGRLQLQAADEQALLQVGVCLRLRKKQKVTARILLHKTFFLTGCCSCQRSGLAASAATTVMSPMQPNGRQLRQRIHVRFPLCCLNFWCCRIIFSLEVDTLKFCSDF